MPIPTVPWFLVWLAMPLSNHLVQRCALALNNMQTHIRLQHWHKLDAAAAMIDVAMQDLASSPKLHDLPQQALTQLSFRQRRITRMLHHAMLANRNERAQVQQGLAQLHQAQQRLKQPENTRL